jgi:hypothetical protein
MLTVTVLTFILSRYTLNNNNKYLLTFAVLTSKLSRYTLNNNNKYLLTLTVLTSILSRYTLNNNIILYANFFDNSAISLLNVDMVFFSNFS